MDYEYLKEINSQEYFSRLSKEYGIEVPNLQALERDYDLIPKGKYGPLEDDVFPGDAAEASGLPEKYVLHLIQIGVVQHPPTYRDVDVLKLIRLVRENDEGAKKSSCRTSSSNLHQELSEPWQQWVYGRYLRNTIIYDASGRMMNPEARIFVRTIAREVAYKFGVVCAQELRNKIRKIRVIAANDKRKARDAEKTLNAVAAKRKIVLDSSD